MHIPNKQVDVGHKEDYVDWISPRKISPKTTKNPYKKSDQFCLANFANQIQNFTNDIIRLSYESVGRGSDPSEFQISTSISQSVNEKKRHKLVVKA